ncbi:MAG: hypothetical protein KY475_06885 [Planctomycetes bacterium]|nr:hypothetical protein [Planctomycetota bacterium]
MELWIALGVMLLMGLLILGVGIFGIRSQRAILPARLRFLLGLFGVKEVTGSAAVVIGAGQCLAGGLLILGALTGPFWAGSLADDEDPPVAASGAPSPPPVRPETPQEPSMRPPPDSAFSDDPDKSGSVDDDARAEADGAVSETAVAAPEQPQVAPQQSTVPTEEPAAEKPLPALETAEQPLPRIEYSAASLVSGESSRRGGDRDREFEEQAPEGGVLVGLRVALRDPARGPVEGVQAIYQVGDRYALGEWRGEREGPKQQLLAPPGYAVGEIRVRQGLFVDAVQLEYHRVDQQGLDASQPIASDWIGGSGGQEKQLAGGRFLVGLQGRVSEQLTSLGVQYLPVELGAPAEAFPAFSYDEGRLQSSPLLGKEAGQQFSDMAPPGALLVGMRLFQGENWGGALQAVQPIYQTQDRYVEGDVFGSPGGEGVLVLAKPGYAVAGVNARSGLVVNALQLIFQELQGVTLANHSAYTSQWIGAEGGSPSQAHGGGYPVVGVFGAYENDLLGIGLVAVERLDLKAPATAERPPMRTWTSADGRFQVQARLIEHTGGAVTLERAGGQQIEVQMDQLSEADQHYLRVTQ